MTLPRKGRRKIVIDGKTYYWTVSPIKEKECKHLKYESTLYIQEPDGNIASITTMTSDGKKEDHSTTPKCVEAIIRGRLKLKAELPQVRQVQINGKTIWD
jgi:hypothetical protein